MPKFDTSMTAEERHRLVAQIQDTAEMLRSIAYSALAEIERDWENELPKLDTLRPGKEVSAASLITASLREYVDVVQALLDLDSTDTEAQDFDKRFTLTVKMES